MLLHVPKRDRYTLGQKIEQLILEILSLLYVTNNKPVNQRIPYLQEIDVKLKLSKTLIRLAHDVKAIDQKRYISLETDLQELGRMLGGWIKSAKENPPR